MSPHLTNDEMERRERAWRVWPNPLYLREAHAALRAEREENERLKTEAAVAGGMLKGFQTGTDELQAKLRHLEAEREAVIARFGEWNRNHIVEYIDDLLTSDANRADQVEKLRERADSDRRLLERCRALLPGLPSVAPVKQLLRDLDARLWEQP